MNPVGMNLSNNVDPTASAMNADYMHNQRMADVMRMQALQPIQNVGASPLSKLSPFQALANVLQAHVANKYNDKAHETQANMLKAMQAHTEQGLQQYMQDYQNDPRAAVMNAMKSQSPVVRAMATQELKGLMTPKTMASHATDASVIGSGGNVQGFAAKDNLKPIQPGSLLMDEQGQLRAPTAQPGANAELVNINGNLMHKTPTGLDPVLKAPNITTTVNNMTPPGESEFEKTLGRREATRLSDDLQQRPGKLEGMQAAQDSLKLLDQGIHTGIFADISKNLEKGYGAVSKMEPEKAARTEQFIANVGNLVIPRLKDFGGSDTVEEMKYLQQVMGGNVKLEASSLRNILNSVEKKLRARVHETDKTIEAYKSRGKTLPTIDAQIQQPVPSQPNSRVMSPEEYLNQFGK
jgi:hypothetical protein